MTVRSFLHIVEIRTKVVSISTFFLAYLASLWEVGSVCLLDMFLLFLAVLSLDMATTAFNTFFDYERGVDHKDHNHESDKVLVHSGIAPGHALITAMVLVIFSAILGLVLVSRKGEILLLLGGISFLVAFLYSGGPFPLSNTPLGEIFAGGFLGTVLWIVVQWTAHPGYQNFLWIKSWTMSIPSFFFIAGILAVNNACDRVGDALSGRKTLAIVLGRVGTIPALFLPFLAYGTWFFLALIGFFPINGLLFASIGFIFQTVINLTDQRLPYSHSTKSLRMQRVTLSFSVFSFLMAQSFLLSLARLF